MKILLFSSLFPNRNQPTHGIFVENRLRHLLLHGGIEARVIAPVPWFPSRLPLFGSYAKFAGVPREETRHGIPVLHPRYTVVPKIGMNWAPGSMARAGLKEARRIQDDGFDFDLIDAHYYYPDGVAAVRIGEALGVPVVVTARGTDINLIPARKGPREMVVDTARRASASIAVCQALKDEMSQLGCAREKIIVLRNGVDLDFFQLPDDRDALREELGYTQRTLISVGHLIERKGHHLVIEAIRHLPDTNLAIIGCGEEEPRLVQLAHDTGVHDRVRFLGRLGQDELRRHYQAADALVLASSREGWANVLLESMACGTRVVATNVWGTPEVVQGPAAGVLVEREAASIATGLATLFDNPVASTETRKYSEAFSWASTSEGQLEVFRRCLGQARPSAVS